MKKAIIIAAVIVLAVIAYRFVERAAPDRGMETYASGAYGISFSYPDIYKLSENDLGSPQRGHYEIVLVDKSQIPDSGEPAPSEGPTSIAVDIFQNDLDGLSANDFVTTTRDSNHKLGDGNIATTTYGSLTGLQYSWSGLYEGRSFVVSTPRFIYMFSTTRLGPDDRIVSDFDRILETVKIK